MKKGEWAIRIEFSESTGIAEPIPFYIVMEKDPDDYTREKLEERLGEAMEIVLPSVAHRLTDFTPCKLCQN
jgi:hypothetical protein